MKTKNSLILSLCLLLSIACACCRDDIVGPGNPRNFVVCPSRESALYVLPYAVGSKYLCTQGFNGTVSHFGEFQYSVDFQMPMGTVVTAARAGIIEGVIQKFGNETIGPDKANVVTVQHDDGTFARYCHLTTNGALVKRGQRVVPGDPIGLSGSSGSAGFYHLHFDVTTGDSQLGSQTIPFCFRNTAAHPLGPMAGVIYLAESY